MKTPSILVVVCGPPCGGKSAIAKRLACHFGFVHLEMDAIRLRLIPESQHQESHRDIAYRAMHQCAELLLGRQLAVVLDATYTRSTHRRELKNLTDRVGTRLYLVQCLISPEVAVARMQLRQAGVHPAVDLTPTSVRKAALQFSYADGALLLRTDCLDVEQCVDQAVSYIEAAEPFTGWSWISFAPENTHTAQPEVSADTVYQEWYNELRRYRDYEHGIVVWASTILVAFTGEHEFLEAWGNLSSRGSLWRARTKPWPRPHPSTRSVSSWLFLGGLLSSRARLRFTNRRLLCNNGAAPCN